MSGHILLVEDDTDIQQFLKELLIDNGYVVDTASNGHAALEKFKNSTPDIIIMDLGLPIMSGEESVKKIKKINKNIPIIILSARDSMSAISKGINLGADEYISKPFVAEELLEKIKNKISKTY
ncbi:MAG TPA: response regulator transcription factor [Candidatus Limnocylindrales bacterium]|nr:response regulator transcription factor [Candidatus Limnocylindrales bacterium]